MEEMLFNGYTLYLSYKNNDVVLGYLRSGKDGLEAISEGAGDTLLGFPNILKNLQDGKLLQMYFGDICHRFTVMLGSDGYEGPYGEDKYLEDVLVTFDTSPILALLKLENVLSVNSTKDEDKVLRKAYRLYGSDKYQFYTKDFRKKENL